MKRRHFKFYFLVTALSCLFNHALFARGGVDTLDSQIGGLKFLSKQVFASERTALSLFPNCKKINSNITLSFDCNIYNKNRFGYIFRLVDCKDEIEEPYLHLLYNPTGIQNDSIKLELYSPVTHSKIEFILPVDNQNKFRLSIHFDVQRQGIKMRCNGEEKSLEGINLNDGIFNIIFGLWGQNPDVAAMNLRNIRIRNHGKTAFFWPLNEYDGTHANEKVTRIKSEIKNPVWLRKDHYSWQKLKLFETDEMVGVVFKEHDQRIYLINKDSLVIFSPDANDFEVLNYSNERPFSKNEHFSIYNNSTDQIISYDFHFLRSPNGKRSFSILNEQTLEWSRIDETSDFVENHHHSIFWNKDNEQVTTFGGYAHFEYFNAFRTYDFSSNSWSDLELRGDTIYPRTHTVVGNNEDSSLFYIYGGFGNEEGQQVLGARIFFDLFSVDIPNKKIKKLLDYQLSDFDFVPRGQLIVDNGEKDFYTLGSKLVDISDLRLYHISPQNESINSISDSIPVLFSNMAGNAFLFKDDISQELYCVTRENNGPEESKVSVYSLKFPPSNLFENNVVRKSNYIKWAAAFFILLIGITAGVYFIRNRNRSKKKNEHKKTVEYSRKNKNAIWLLGGFKVYDPEGTDITYRFSKKLKELFLLVFFETLNNEGISSRHLSETLWPRMDKYSQKNNRGVTINNLRKVLEDLQGIKLINANNKWKLEREGDFYCDFMDVKRSLEKKEYINNPHYLISMFSFGNILPNLQFEWLDKYKSRYEKNALFVLYSACDNFFAEKKFLACLETAQIIHEKIDPIDEMALVFKIKALNKMKSYKKSHDEFELFKKMYFNTYNDQYALTFDEIVNLQSNLDRLI